MTATLQGLKRQLPTTAIVLMTSLLALASAGCSSKTDGAVTADASGKGAAAEAGENGLPPTSANITYAKGWNELDVDANTAKNTLDPAGHFHTDHNMCQQPGDGVFDVAAWNIFVTALNQVVTTDTLPTPRCWDSPNGSKFYNKGIAELVLANGSKRALYEYKNGQICTTLADASLSDSLMQLLEKMLLLDDRADAQSCPNYRPGT